MKTPDIRKVTPAFTLIELLVVIGIIATLTAAAIPALNAGLMAAKVGRATSDARQIGLAMRMYAHENDGAFPSGEEIRSSNDAFRLLFPDYLQTESVFAVTNSPVGRQADNKIEPANRVLERGENHWAFIAGLSETSNGGWPLIVDHTDGSGTYTRAEGEKGGTWKGTKAVMIRCDSSAVAPRLKGTGSKRFLPRHDDDTQNALAVGEYMGREARLLEPES